MFAEGPFAMASFQRRDAHDCNFASFWNHRLSLHENPYALPKDDCRRGQVRLSDFHVPVEVHLKANHQTEFYCLERIALEMKEEFLEEFARRMTFVQNAEVVGAIAMFSKFSLADGWADFFYSGRTLTLELLDEIKCAEYVLLRSSVVQNLSPSERAAFRQIPGGLCEK